MAPADSETVCLFSQFLARSFKAPQSILNYVASAKLLHTLLELDTSLFNSIEYKSTKNACSGPCSTLSDNDPADTQAIKTKS